MGLISANPDGSGWNFLVCSLDEIYTFATLREVFLQWKPSYCIKLLSLQHGVKVVSLWKLLAYVTKLALFLSSCMFSFSHWRTLRPHAMFRLFKEYHYFYLLQCCMGNSSQYLSCILYSLSLFYYLLQLVILFLLVRLFALILVYLVWFFLP